MTTQSRATPYCSTRSGKRMFEKGTVCEQYEALVLQSKGMIACEKCAKEGM